MTRAVVVVAAEGLPQLVRSFQDAPAKGREAARRAVNAAAKHARTAAAASIRRQIVFAPSYLNANLKVTGWATLASLSAEVTGRDRPTSLARFAVNRSDAGKRRPARLKVKPSAAARVAKRTFLVPLSGGNVGLAVRLSLAEAVERRKQGRAGLVPFGRAGTTQAYLLYGPSIDQVFDETRDEVAPLVGRKLALEWLRQARIMGVAGG